jgi:serine/threonine protein kinase
MLEAGRQFAHFSIIRLLGEGGMGQVYLAEDQKLGRQVALKVLTKQYFNDTERMQRFEREASFSSERDGDL